MTKTIEAIRSLLPEIADVSNADMRAKIENIWLEECGQG
jgi:hypothetical protein